MYGRFIAGLMLAFASAAMAATAAPALAAPRQVGVAEEVPDLRTAAAMRQSLHWTTLGAGGHVAAVTLASPGATALRVGLRIGQLPESARLRFFSGPDDRVPVEVSGARVLAALARNGDAGETGGTARTWWSPVVTGSSMVMEVELPPGIDPQSVAFTAPLISHLTLDVRAELAALRSSGDVARSLAVYTTDGASYVCPGMLVAPSAAPTARPYFLTANRCVASQSAASSMELFWDAGPSGAAPGDPSNGAALLYAAARTDTAFLALDAPPPGDGAYARWAAGDAKSGGLVLDPALEQWLGAGVARTASSASFSLP
jgi:lysyl endopeptidase